MELLTAFNIATGFAAAVLGYFVGVLLRRIDKLETANEKLLAAITELRVDLPKSYTSKEDFRTMGDSLFSALRSLSNDMKDGFLRIENKLENKVDKKP